ncbi:SusC/RagA family TonB-linked outer membrane protein [Pedobacter hiemivivus]|uniref:SusC/RagA family TonB-linked outer membrane protein n=2 Tax=Pedobacter hiemivivus TaxID=2530454 RepID=A0A4U1GQI6_9SPHI|nr:SusC/RagA family TonB-linked outer membrane protein [Pedobacter hiemivivus]
MNFYLVHSVLSRIQKIDKRKYIMRINLTIIMLTGFLLQVSIAGNAQKINLIKRNIQLQEVFREIGLQTGYDFVYSTQLIKQAERVNVTAVNASLQEVLNACFKDQPFEYEISDNSILIKRRKLSAEELAIQQLTMTITGKVTDAAGKPMPGVNIRYAGAKTAKITDEDGKYSIEIPDGNVELIFTYVGYKVYKVKPGTRKVLHVQLELSTGELDGVVVTGYQEIRKDRVTGSVTVLTAKELENNSFRTIDQILEGKVPGLYSYSTSGAPGVRSNIRIRGDNSISGNKEPLWVVDGLPLQGGVASINVINTGNIQESILDHGIANLSPTDIESITILKDAAAAAIYGARAANGVIVIKTKKGSVGKTNISYNGSYGIGEAPSVNLNFMNSAEKIKFEEDLMDDLNKAWEGGTVSKIYAQYQNGYLSKEAYEAQMDQLRAINTNWFDVIFRTSRSQSHAVSMRGGAGNTSYFSSFNYNNQQGVLEHNKYNQLGAKIEIVHSPSEKFDITFGLNGTYRKNNSPNSAVDPFKYAVFANPYEKPFDENGNYYRDASYLGDNRSVVHFGAVYDKFNILRELSETGNQSIASDLTARLGLRYQVLKGLKADVLGSITYSTNNTEGFAAAGTYSSFSGNFSGGVTGLELPDGYNNGYLKEGSGRTSAVAMRGLLSYNNDDLADHSFSLVTGTELSSSNSNNSFHKFVEYDELYRFVSMPSYVADVKYVDMKSKLGGLSGTAVAEDRSLSFFAAFTYTLKDKYVFNINSRFDGASTIGSASRFTPLWSASTRWNIMRENFLKKVKVISDLALRLSYGYTGNIDRSAYPVPLVFLGALRYNDEYTAQSVSFPNPNIKWEKKEDRNIGLDFGLFENVIGGSINYYNNNIRDLMGGLTTPISYGRSSIQINGLSLNNTGWDANINFRLKFGKNVRWINSFNIGQNKNMITKAYRKSLNDLDWKGGSDNIEGYATGATFGYDFAGVSPLTGGAMIYLSDASRQLLATAQGKDISQISDKFDAEDKTLTSDMREKVFRKSMHYLGSLMPQYNGGFSSTVTWKSLELRAGFSYATGFLLEAFNERKNAPSGYNKLSEVFVSKTNRLKSAMDRWRSVGDITNVPRYQGSSTTYLTLVTDDKYERGDYLSFRDIVLTYNIKGEFLNKTGIKSCRIGLQVNNPYVFTRYTGLDATKGGAFNYPTPRVYMLNLSLGL